MKIGAIKNSTPEANTHVIPEDKKTPYTSTRVYSTSAHKYNTRSRTYRTHHVTTFKNVPKVLPLEPTTKTKLHRGTNYNFHIDPKNMQS